MVRSRMVMKYFPCQSQFRGILIRNFSVGEGSISVYSCFVVDYQEDVSSEKPPWPEGLMKF